jgi:tRNA (cmo5U34)-methyltransferase
MSRNKDQLYAESLSAIVDFEFDESVSHVFADMINRSVPGYATIINMIGMIAAQHAQPNSHIYDLGCSLGACSLAIAQQIQCQNVRIYAVDNSQPMLNKLSEHLSDNLNIQVVLDDISAVEMTNSSVIVLNFTLQFIAAEQREKLLQKIYSALKPGGLLILSEKLVETDEPIEQCLSALHHQFKRNNGYSDLEIAQKRIALEKTLIPETLDTHLRRLKKIGFQQANQWFQCFNFASIMAIK